MGSNPIWGSDFFCVLLWLILYISLYFVYNNNSLIFIHWIVIYLVDSTIQLLNNWGQDLITVKWKILKPRGLHFSKALFEGRIYRGNLHLIKWKILKPWGLYFSKALFEGRIYRGNLHLIKWKILKPWGLYFSKALFEGRIYRGNLHLIKWKILKPWGLYFSKALFEGRIYRGNLHLKIDWANFFIGRKFKSAICKKILLKITVRM